MARSEIEFYADDAAPGPRDLDAELDADSLANPGLDEVDEDPDADQFLNLEVQPLPARAEADDVSAAFRWAMPPGVEPYDAIHAFPAAMPPGRLSAAKQIIWLEDAAARIEDVGGRVRERAAELIAAELDAGKSLRGLAKEIGKSHEHVRRMRRTWQLKVTGDERPFNELYNSSDVRAPRRVIQGKVEQPALPPPPALENAGRAGGEWGLQSPPDEQPAQDQPAATHDTAEPAERAESVKELPAAAAVVTVSPEMPPPAPGQPTAAGEVDCPHVWYVRECRDCGAPPEGVPSRITGREAAEIGELRARVSSLVEALRESEAEIVSQAGRWTDERSKLQERLEDAQRQLAAQEWSDGSGRWRDLHAELDADPLANPWRDEADEDPDADRFADLEVYPLPDDS